jgi:vancomycin resistance protein YoaR
VALKQLRRVRSPVRAWVILAAAVLLSACALGYAVILPGTRVCGVDVGGLTVSGAAARLESALKWDERNVTLTGNGRSIEASFAADLGIEPDIEETAKACRRPLWMLLKKENPLIMAVDPVRLSSFATGLSSLLDVEVRDARLGFAEGDRVVVFPERAGSVLDFAGFQGFFLAARRLQAIPETIEVPLMRVEPQLLARDLERFLPMERVSSFATYYADGSDRAFNIGLACIPLAELAVWPGGTFSFNSVVGPRTAERGYRKAPVFVGDETVDDFGGGVCQVSTTLYVSLLKAGFEVRERYSHSKPVDYVPMGLDATVTFDYLDLKMTNPGDSPCLIRVTGSGGELRADVFGKAAGGLSIELESRILKEFPAVPYPPGSPAQAPDGQRKLRDGYLVETIRKYIRDGRLEQVEHLGTSMYPPEKYTPPRVSPL